jgi:hypothetical protein
MGFLSSSSSQSGAYDMELSGMLESSPSEIFENQLQLEVAVPPDKPESMMQPHLYPSFDMDASLKPGAVSSTDKVLLNLPDVGKALEDTHNFTPQLPFEPDEDWLGSFVDLGMCSDDYSDFAAEAADFAGLPSELELPFQHEPINYAKLDIKISNYIEPHLTVMAQWDHTDNAPQQPTPRSLPSSDAGIDDSQSSASSLPQSPLTFQSAALPQRPSKAGDSRLKRVPGKCPYCYKSFPPSELK